MKTLLLIAGRSKRFWPLREKSLWPLLGEPLLSHQIRRLRDGGLTDIILVGGKHNLEEARTLFPSVASVEQEDLDLGMRGALLSALPGCGDEPVCIVSGNDVISSAGYRALAEVAGQSGVDGAILAQRVGRYFPGGYLMTVPDKGNRVRVTGVVEKPGEGKEPSDLVNIVAHIHNHPGKLLEILRGVSSEKDDAYEIALTKLCGEGKYIAVPYEHAWNAVKYPWHLLDLSERLLGELGEPRTHESAQIHRTAVVEGRVILEQDVRILAHASVVGPCYIGRGSVICNNALVRQSIVGEKCVIGYGSEVARSILHSHVWTHSTYLGDTVVGRNVSFGAGSVMGNFRLDEGEITSVIDGKKVGTQRTKLGAVIGDDVRVGIHASFAPGVKIGQGTFVSSAVYVRSDVEEGKYVSVKDGVLDIRTNSSQVPPVRG